MFLIQIIRGAIESTINDDKVHTEDLGGNASTSEVVDSILLHVQKQMSSQRWQNLKIHDLTHKLLYELELFCKKNKTIVWGVFIQLIIE